MLFDFIIQLSIVKFEGIIPATVTPMNERYQIVEEDLRNYMKWLMKFNLGGLAINVDTGEGPFLTRKERRAVLSIVSSVVKKKVPVIAGVPPASTAEASECAVDNKDAGADGLLVFPNPSFYGKPLHPELPYLYHKALADASHLPIILFQLQPDLGGYDLTPETILRLLDIPEVAAIKEASFDARKYYEMLKIIRNAPRKISFLTGNDNFILESFFLGADGALIGFGTLATGSQVEMLQKVKNGEFKDAIEIWERLKPLMQTIFAPPVRDYRARTKVALAYQGIIESVYVRPPLLQLSRGEADEVRQALKKAEIPIERRGVAITRQ
jgi:4-hydroxy-tetrahydrodipicolinate synthase